MKYYYYKGDENGVVNRFSHYARLTAGSPYIIGFPGVTFYEFDLSGEWSAQNTAAPAPAKLGKQIISFVSEPGIGIGVSDDELTASPIDGYAFTPNYMSRKVEGYLMNADGNSFDQTLSATEPATPVAVAAVPFRPYFVPGTSNARQNTTRSIVFDSTDWSDDEDPSENDISGDLSVSVRRHSIVVTSSLRRATKVQIVNTVGQTIAAFIIQPGETINTDIDVAGIYIIRAANGRIQKKIALK